MQSTSGGQRQVVTEFGATTSDAAAAVRQITGTSQELARTMSEVNEMASRTGARAEEGRQDLAGMDATMQELARSTTSFSAKLATISERATTINRVVGTMTKVANQTNLLSLNAALEAERAGKYGLGFRVVASEISRLADQTAVAALDIEQMVKDMQHSVHAGVNEMQAFDTQVQGGVVRIGDISAKLGEIISAVQGISGRFEQVTEGMCAQSQGAEQIREAMARLSDGASRTAASLNEFNVATTNLRGAVDELNGEVTRFIV
jgi:methyl-accepting chemotaxis protein WspA